MTIKTIANGADTPIDIRTGTIPDVSGAMRDWYQPLTFFQVTKSVVDFQVVEDKLATNFWGVVQPLTDRRLVLKPEGQRAWTWIWVHADPVLAFEVDDIVEYLGTRYRVTSRRDYSIYGYMDYELVQDWGGAVPVLTHTILQLGLTMPGVAA